MKASKLARFSLRTLLLLITLSCLAMGVWAVYVQPYRLQSQAVLLIERSKGTVEFQAARGTDWQRWLVVNLLGKERYVRVTSADLHRTQPSRESLQSLRRLCFLEELDLDNTDTDDGLLVGISQLEELQKLSLRYTAITDAGIESLKKCGRLEELYLTGTEVSDDGAKALAELTNLRKLFIRWTKITSSGADRLRASLPECDMHHHKLVVLD